MSAEFNASVTLAWSEYTARVGIDPSKFTDMEKIAFQAGVAAMAHDTQRLIEAINGLMGLVQLIGYGDGVDHTKNHRYADAATLVAKHEGKVAA